jgi:hypothetical protein
VDILLNPNWLSLIFFFLEIENICIVIFELFVHTHNNHRLIYFVSVRQWDHREYLRRQKENWVFTTSENSLVIVSELFLGGMGVILMDFWPEFVACSWGREFVAGGFGGIAGIISGYPLDTLRVRQQHSNAGSAFRILRNVMAAEGPAALYRGMGAPLASVTFQVFSPLFLCQFD